MLRKILLALLLLILLVIGGLAATLFYIDGIARSAVEKGGTYALGVPTRLESAHVGVFSGTFGLGGLEVENPEGFEAKRFLALREGAAEVDLGSLRTDKVEIPTIRLAGIRMVLEKRDGKANYELILEHLESLTGPGEPAPEAQQAGKSFVIRELIIEDAEVDVQLLPVGGELTRTTVPLERIRLTDIGEGEQGVKMSELSGVIVQAILAATLRKSGELPGQLAGELGRGLAGVGSIATSTLQVADETFGNLGQSAGDLLKEAGIELEVPEGVKQAGDKAGEAIEETGKKAEEAAKKIGEGLGGLFGGSGDEGEDDGK